MKALIYILKKDYYTSGKESDLEVYIQKKPALAEFHREAKRYLRNNCHQVKEVSLLQYETDTTPRSLAAQMFSLGATLAGNYAIEQYETDEPLQVTKLEWQKIDFKMPKTLEVVV
jgi:hypothetical protein